MSWRWPSQNTFRMWIVLYWTRSSITQFGVSINVWRLAGDTLNITCSFLYCNHQPRRMSLSYTGTLDVKSSVKTGLHPSVAIKITFPAEFFTILSSQQLLIFVACRISVSHIFNLSCTFSLLDHSCFQQRAFFRTTGIPKHGVILIPLKQQNIIEYATEILNLSHAGSYVW